MATLKPLAAAGKGNVAVILPDTVSSTRYVEFDAPYLKKSCRRPGCRPRSSPCRTRWAATPPSFSDAQTAITKGASVLVVDPLDSGVGAHIESYAKAHGVAVIDYDRLTLGGTREYYVSFNNVQVGTLIGQGLVSCVAAWNVKKPQVIVMQGAPDRQQRHAVRPGLRRRARARIHQREWKDVSNPPAPGTRRPR